MTLIAPSPEAAVDESRDAGAVIRTARPRSSYLDTLRVFALGRVVLLHSFFIGWTSFLFPSMGVMFALGGSLTAASLSNKTARTVVFSRGRRMLVPLWAFAVIAVPAMVITGWSSEVGGYQQLDLSALLSWIIPFQSPAGSEHWDLLWRTLWYLRTYLWLVIATPPLLWAYKRKPLVTALGAVSLSAFIQTDWFANLGALGFSLTDLTMYVSFWVLGFAHHYGHIQKISNRIYAMLMIASVAWAIASYLRYAGYENLELTTKPMLNVAWSLPFLLVFLRWNPKMLWLDAYPRVHKFISAVNSRAVTIYLWHTTAILLAVNLVSVIGMHERRPLEIGVQLVATVLLLAGFALVFGRVEEWAKQKGQGARISRINPR